ncbi:MAG TPA: kynureninase [Steroidobacteraceae bacterium]|nr:kynureninase [Steroidobacteraceae bacterium]
MNFPLDRSFAEQQDRADPLAKLRDEFRLPTRADGTPQVYLCGHSLGLQPKAVASILQEELDSWAHRAVDGHFESNRPWLSYHERFAPSLARLVGAQPLEVVAMNTLTVNLHLMLTTFYRPTRERSKILIEKNAFGSDRYAVASQVRLHGFDPRTAMLEIGPRTGEEAVRNEDVLALIEREGAQIATVMLPAVQFLNGQRFDLRAIAQAARRAGCRVGFDLAHAIGNVPLELHDSGADFAVWCHYKYLNAGPGAVGGAFVHERHARDFDLERLAGWWGHDKASRFLMPHDFQPLPGAEGWQISNLPILAAAPLLASLPLFDQAGMPALRAKSVQLTGYLESLLRAQLAESVTILTPRDPEARGCQLSLRLRRTPSEAHKVFDALAAAGCTGDWREPDVIRVAPIPLYNTFVEAWEFAAALGRILQ